MKLFSRVFLCAVALCASVRSASAQAAAAEPWSFAVGVGGSYEGNALFVGPEGDEDFSHSVTTALGRSFALKRGAVQLSANASQFFYRKTASLSNLRYGFGGSVSHALTRRLNW